MEYRLKGAHHPWLIWVCILFDLNKDKITPEKYFMDANIEEVYILENFYTSTKLLRKILDAKYEKVD